MFADAQLANARRVLQVPGPCSKPRKQPRDSSRAWLICFMPYCALHVLLCCALSSLVAPMDLSGLLICLMPCCVGRVTLGCAGWWGRRRGHATRHSDQGAR